MFGTYGLASAPLRKGYLELVLRRLSGFGALAAFEEDAIRGLTEPRQHLPKGRELTFPGRDRLSFLLEGWACRARDLKPQGRQIFDLILPGDMVGHLPSEIEQPKYAWIALTNVTIIDATSLGETDDAGRALHPGFMSALANFRRQAQEHILDHMVRLGARKAYESVGHLLLELYVRQAAVGLAAGGKLPFPVGQERLGEILGISEAHVNRTLTRLRNDGHVITGPGWIALPKLRELAQQVYYPLSPTLLQI